MTGHLIQNRSKLGLLVFLLGWGILIPAPASAVITITPNTWNIIGLDSNTPAFGPNRFPVGAEVCSTTAVTNVPVVFTWDSANTYVNLRPGSLSTITIPSIGAGACVDVFFEVEVDKVAAAFDTAREYHITASGVSTPIPRELYVEQLISQSRNSISDVLLDGVSIPAGGSMNLIVGETYTIDLIGGTATQGYNQFEKFINFSNAIFQMVSVDTLYSANDSPYVDNPNDTLYADACLWENNPNSPYYLSCVGGNYNTGGSTVTTTFVFKIISGGGTTEILNSLLYDFSGSSFHYNADYSTGARFANIIDPASVTISKNFRPDPTQVNGVSALTFTLTNPNAGPVTDVNFTDVFPTSPGAMVVASPPNATTSGCGIPTFAPVAGAGSISFSNGTLAAGSSCTIKVNVTAPTSGTYNNTSGNLMIGTIDTGNSASDSLVVNTSPPAPSPVCGLSMATWTVPVGSPNPPIFTTKAANVGTALASAFALANTAIGTTGQDDLAAWNTYGYKSVGQYIEFVVDTSQYEQVFMSFYIANPSPANGPTSVILSYDKGAGFTNWGTLATPPIAFTLYSIDFTNLTSTTGTTTFRITSTGAKNNASGASLNFDNIVFNGCSIPLPPTLSKSFSPSPVAVGATSTLSFTVTNTNATVGLNGLAFTDTLPAGLTVTSNGGVAQCGGTLTTTAPSTISFSGGVLAGGLSCVIPVTVTATTAGPKTNVSGFVSATESGTNTGSTGIATATLIGVLPPEMSKLFAPDPILMGEISTLTFTLINPNQNDTLSGVAFSDTFPVAPGAMVVAAVPNATTSGCGVPTFVPVAAAGSISFSAGTIVGGGTCTVTVDITAPTVGTYSNVSGAVSHIINAATVNGSNAEASLDVNAASPGIGLLKQVGSTLTGPWTSFLAVVIGSNVYYSFTVENTGDVPLSPVSLTDPTVDVSSCAWPASLPVAVAINDNHIATCVVGPIVAVAGSTVNTATASGTYSATPYTDMSTAVYATTALTIVKTAAEAYFLAEADTLNYSFVVANTGFAALMGPVTVADDKTTVSCPAVSTATVTSPAGPGDGDTFLDPGEELTCTASYTILAADVTAKGVTNNASATVDGVQTADTSLTVPLAPDLTVAKTNTISDAATNGVDFDWTLTVTNVAAAGLATFTDTQVTLVDDLPTTGATYSVPATATNAGATAGTIDCAIATNTLTCTANGTVTIPAGDSFSIVVTVTPTAVGTLENPKSGGTCAVDPATVVAEIDETNNDCANTVTVSGATVFSVVKSVTVISDPFNGTTNPKSIPGSIVEYTLVITNASSVVDANTVIVIDAIPANTDLLLGDIGGVGSGPVAFTDGGTASALTYTFTALGNMFDDVGFSNDGGTSYGYDPTVVDGVDITVRHIQITPQGSFAADGVFQLDFRVRIR